MNKEIQEEDRELEEPPRTCRSTSGEESSQEETYLGTRSYPRCRKIWGSRIMHGERKRTKSSFDYVALLCDIIDKEPSNYEEVVEKREWKDAMIEEYQSIMKNDVWDVWSRDLKGSLL